MTPDPATLTGPALLALVQCPPASPDYKPREQASPSALQGFAACRRSWGERYLAGRREPSLPWSVAEHIPEPAKPVRGSSALAKATAEALRRAWNKVRRPALGTDAHEILGAYMRQNCPGAWHPPMAWREVNWETRAGAVARPAADVLPDPRGLLEVHTELAALVEAPAGWCAECGGYSSAGCHEPWPRMPGFYDLITVEAKHYGWTADAEPGAVLVCRLWDFKTTSSFDWAKTAEELAEDPQVLLYALHAMQTWGLEAIECTWIYLLTEGKPRAYPVTVTITRAEAEAAVLEMAETAAEIVETVRAFKAGRLRVIDLEQNVSACKAYGGCVYHADKGGPCAAKVSPGKAAAQRAELDTKITARKSARKANEKTMATDFAARQAARAAKLAEEAKGGAVDTTTADAPEQTSTAASAGGVTAATTPAPSEAASAATAAARANKPKAVRASAPVDVDAVTATVGGFEFVVPAGSTLGKALAKAAKGLQAAAAAFEGE